MYTPKHLQMTDFTAVSKFIVEYGFGTLISADLEVTRLPLIFEQSTSGMGRIIGHMARANPHWKKLHGARVSALFDGPHAYISPNWYVNKPSVPTWNYASVQCFGQYNQLDESGTLRAIQSLVQKYEPDLLNDSQIMPKDHIDKLLKAVVGFEIIVDDIHAKQKLGQHKSTEDQIAVYHALHKNDHPDSQSLARYMKQRNIGIGK